MSVVDEIKQRLDIVEFIAGYVPLQKAGRNFKGSCPFHSEKTPSFIVFPDSQGWHCFGACSTGGDIFTFLMRRENLEFPEALRVLAERAGVELHPLDQEELKQRDQAERLRALNADAAQFWHQQLMRSEQGEAVRGYLERRGLSRDSIVTWQLGSAPDGWHSLEEALTGAGYKQEELLQAGLLIKNEAGRVYDRFRARLMFPICDPQAHVVGFAGRVLDDSQPKYMNTPDTPLFDKGSILYGLHLTRESIRQSGTAVVVEGYMDVIVPYQLGVRNLVACMGTALTEAHIKALKRSTKRLILALDPDEAGLRAMEKGVETAREGLERRVVPVLTPTGLVRYEAQLDAEIRVLELPDGLDPDQLVLRDRARWDALVAGASPVADFYLNKVLAQLDISTAKGKREMVERFLPVVAAMDSPVERSHYVQRLAQRVHLEESVLLAELARLRSPAASARATRRPPRRAAAVAEGDQSTGQPAGHPEARVTARNMARGLEERCMALLLANPSLIRELRTTMDMAVEALQDVRSRELLRSIEQYCATRPRFDMDDWRSTLDSTMLEHVQSLLHTLSADPPHASETAREDLVKCAMRLQRQHLSRLIQELRFAQQDAQEQQLTERSRELAQMVDRLTRTFQEVDRRYHAATLLGRSRSNGAVEAGRTPNA